ncbi:hypothetical protein CEXT_558521 [Caerostris extrusa]|uniref:Uncharacterized protein n=1 Tax=Caerostris extrusa TaxID=172846 RepID=A0AAV4P523_CAEEX|nr:hypothetical protein CEXT_558521 [Caerostris extrusa]
MTDVAIFTFRKLSSRHINIFYATIINTCHVNVYSTVSVRPISSFTRPYNGHWAHFTAQAVTVRKTKVSAHFYCSKQDSARVAIAAHPLLLKNNTTPGANTKNYGDTTLTIKR